MTKERVISNSGMVGANSNHGVRNSYYGVRNSYYGVRNSNHGILPLQEFAPATTGMGQKKT